MPVPQRILDLVELFARDADAYLLRAPTSIDRPIARTRTTTSNA